MGSWVDVFRVPLRTLNLDPPMILPRFLVSRRVGPAQARCAGAERAAPGAHPAGAPPTLRVAHREGRLGDSGDVLRGTHRTLNALKGTLKTPSHVPKTPLTSHTQPAPPTKRTLPAKRAPLAKRAPPAGPLPAGPRGRADLREDHRWIQAERLQGALQDMGR